MPAGKNRRCRAKGRPTASPSRPIDCAVCDNSRVVPHPDPEKANSLNVPCLDCSRITKTIRGKYLANPTECSWCRGTIQADAAPDVDEGIVTQEIDCTQ